MTGVVPDVPQPLKAPREYGRRLRETSTPPDAQRQTFAIPADYLTMTPDEQAAWRDKVIAQLRPVVA